MDIKVVAMKVIISTAIILVVLTVNVPSIAIEPSVSVSVQEPSRSERILICEATAYCYGTVTKTGTSPVEGRTIAVDPEVIPLGSRVHVSCEIRPEIDGWYIAEDTGGVIKGNIIDIYMKDYNDCIQWGRRQVKVKLD
jgi:3D (Asp-Asp-Asp) domain-containing protein